MNKAVYCQKCGFMIVFNRTVKGAYMPCDTPSVWYKPDPNGKDTILDDRGEIVKGWILREKADGLQLGHKPHFISCKGYKKPEKAAQPENEQISLF